jgi:Outer membrane protein beta-barrel domain
MSNKIHIDELFREGLNNGEEAMVPSAWSNMAKMLDGDNPYEKEQTKKRPFLWILGMGLLLISAIAAGTKFLFPGGQMQQNAVSLVVPPAQQNKTENDDKAQPLALATSSAEQNNEGEITTASNNDANNLSVASEKPAPLVQNNTKNAASINSNLTKPDVEAAQQNTAKATSKTASAIHVTNNSNSVNVNKLDVKSVFNKIAASNTNGNNFENNVPNAVASNIPNKGSNNANATAKNVTSNKQTTAIENLEDAKVDANTNANLTSITALPILSVQQFLLSINSNKDALHAAKISHKNNLVMLPEATDVKDTFGYIIAVNNKPVNTTSISGQTDIAAEDKLVPSNNQKPTSNDAPATSSKKTSKKTKASNKKEAAQSAENSAIATSTDTKKNASSNNSNATTNTASTDNANAAAQQNSNNQLLANRKKEAPKKSATPSAKEQMSDKLMSTIDKIKSRGFIDLGAGKIKVDPALFTGINSQFLNNKNDLGGFHMGMNCIIQIRRNLELMPHALFNYRTNGGYTIRDTVQTITDRSGPRFNGTDNEFAYTATTTAMTYNFKRTMSIEAPIALQWRPVRRVGIFAGVNLAYGFKYKTSNFYKTTTTAEIDIVPTTQNYAFPTDRISTYKDIDFKGRFGAGYLFGANWQATPNFFVDARVAQNIWDNSTTPSSKIISSNVFKVPAFQLSLGYRFKGLEE